MPPWPIIQMTSQLDWLRHSILISDHITKGRNEVGDPKGLIIRVGW
jgi:hypothetical protein